jgi:hypothetical protein
VCLSRSEITFFPTSVWSSFSCLLVLLSRTFFVSLLSFPASYLFPFCVSLLTLVICFLSFVARCFRFFFFCLFSFSVLFLCFYMNLFIFLIWVPLFYYAFRTYFWLYTFSSPSYGYPLTCIFISLMSLFPCAFGPLSILVLPLVSFLLHWTYFRFTFIVSKTIVYF